MKKPSFDLKQISIKSLLKFFQKDIAVVLWIFLALTVVLVGWIVSKEIGHIRTVSSDLSGITGEIVRTNLSQYQQLEQKLDDNARFVPATVEGTSAFGSPPKKVTDSQSKP